MAYHSWRRAIVATYAFIMKKSKHSSLKKSIVAPSTSFAGFVPALISAAIGAVILGLGGKNMFGFGTSRKETLKNVVDLVFECYDKDLDELRIKNEKLEKEITDLKMKNEELQKQIDNKPKRKTKK